MGFLPLFVRALFEEGRFLRLDQEDRAAILETYRHLLEVHHPGAVAFTITPRRDESPRFQVSCLACGLVHEDTAKPAEQIKWHMWKAKHSPTMEPPTDNWGPGDVGGIWHRGTPPRGVRCLVTTQKGRVAVASISPDHLTDVWLSNGSTVDDVIAWMKCPSPAEPVASPSKRDSDEAAATAAGPPAPGTAQSPMTIAQRNALYGVAASAAEDVASYRAPKGTVTCDDRRVERMLARDPVVAELLPRALAELGLVDVLRRTAEQAEELAAENSRLRRVAGGDPDIGVNIRIRVIAYSSEGRARHQAECISCGVVIDDRMTDVTALFAHLSHVHNSSRRAVPPSERPAQHHLVVTPTNREAVHTGRPLFRVECLSCHDLIHEETTGPGERVTQHLARRDLAGRVPEMERTERSQMSKIVEELVPLVSRANIPGTSVEKHGIINSVRAMVDEILHLRGQLLCGDKHWFAEDPIGQDSRCVLPSGHARRRHEDKRGRWWETTSSSGRFIDRIAELESAIVEWVACNEPTPYRAGLIIKTTPWYGRLCNAETELRRVINSKIPPYLRGKSYPNSRLVDELNTDMTEDKAVAFALWSAQQHKTDIGDQRSRVVLERFVEQGHVPRWVIDAIMAATLNLRTIIDTLRTQADR